MAKQSMAQQIQAAVAAALAGTATGGNLLHAAQSVPTFSFNGEWISFGLSEAPKNPKNAAPRICGLTGATIPAGAAIFYDRRTKSAALASAVVARYPQLFKG